jgi:hypothetical protein
MDVGFADGAEIEAAGEALRGERMVEEFGELTVEAHGEEESEPEIEEVGPDERGKAAQREREAVEQDVAAFRHGGPFYEVANLCLCRYWLNGWAKRPMRRVVLRVG